MEKEVYRKIEFCGQQAARLDGDIPVRNVVDMYHVKAPGAQSPKRMARLRFRLSTPINNATSQACV